jgi:2-polyprenyl-6-methoxyphenol hydroxylase-like FAD-dependent oxidoreductase
MANEKLNDIAIIGGGLGGLLLAVFLADRNIRSTIYESRVAEPPGYSGPVMLLPNGLRVLDKVGAYEQILAQGSLAPYNYSMSNNHEVLDRRECGDIEKYGYVGLRIYRQKVINIFTEMARKRNVTIVHGKRFSHILAETNKNVTFAFADGDIKTHSLLIGSDGIHSVVREYVAPQTKLRFSGSLSILGFVPASAVHLPYPEYPLPAAVMGPAGNILFGWADDEAGEYPLATNFAMEDLGREGWDELRNDTPRLLAMMRNGYEKWNPMIQGILDNVKEESLFIWPFYTVPTLDSWKSDKGRVVVLGDAAHAIPPQGGI